MPRKESVAVPEGNGPIPSNTYVLPGITVEDFRRVLWWKVWKEVCEANGLKKPEKPKDMRAMDQREASPEQDA